MKYLSNRIEIAAILLVALLALFSVNAYAANDTVKAYSPTSAWLVGPASLDKEAVTGENGKMPCVVANQYSNGFVVRFSGGGDQLMAMAIDFRQKVFTPRQKYDVEFSVPGKFFQILSGAAYDEGTLLFSLYKTPDFYKVIQKADAITMKVSDTAVTINLVGLNDGFRRMNDCYDPDRTIQAQVQVSTQPPAAKTSTKDSTRQNPLLAGGAGGPLTPMPGDVAEVPMPVPVQKTAVNRPGGMDPEASVNAVLQNGGDVSPAGGSASQLVSGAKSAQQAAEQLAANNPMKAAPRPSAPPVQAQNPNAGVPLTGSWSQPNQSKTGRANGSEVMVQNGPQAAATDTQPRRWRAVKGADTHDVLSSWAGGSNVKLMWLANQDFAVPRSMMLTGTFQDAVQQMLEQFNDEKTRPVGRIYREPGTSQLVLVIEQSAEPANP